MIRDQVIGFLSSAPGGSAIKRIIEHCELSVNSESSAALELLCHYIPEVTKEGEKWKLAQVGRSSKILAAIENYAVSSGKKVFRLSSALAALPAHEHPTEDELRHALEISHGRFKLLPNAMIKKMG